MHIALLNGHINGISTGFGVNAHIRVATEKTSFCMPECMLGFIPDGGASHYFSRLFLTKELGLYFALTGIRIVGLDNLKYGVATHYVKNEKLFKIKDEIIASYSVKE